MEITDVKVRLVRGASQKVKAFCTITIDDCFVVKDIKVIAGDDNEFIAMPSRKLSEKCGKCGRKNPVDSSFCGSCGAKQPGSGRNSRESSPYSDIAHPINSECRTHIQERVIDAYRQALAENVPVAELVDSPPPAPEQDVPVAELVSAPEPEPLLTENAEQDISAAVEDTTVSSENSDESTEDTKGGFSDGIY